MEQVLAALDFKALGGAGIIIAVLIYMLIAEKKEKLAEREYSKKINEEHHKSTITWIEMLGKLESGFISLRDLIKDRVQ